MLSIQTTSSDVKLPYMTKIVGDRIRHRRTELGLTQAVVGHHVGVNRVSVSQWESGYFHPKGANLMKLAEILQCEPEWLVDGGAATEPGPQQSRRAREKQPVQAEAQSPAGTDFPIYGSSESESAGMSISDDVIEQTTWPGPLIGVKGAFGLYVIGDEMSPAYRPGDLILVHPSKPAQIGDDVLVGHANGAAVIGQLAQASADRVQLHQYGSSKPVEIPRSEVDRTQLIVGCFRRG